MVTNLGSEDSGHSAISYLLLIRIGIVIIVQILILLMIFLMNIKVYLIYSFMKKIDC